MAKKKGPSPEELSEGTEIDMTPMIDVTFLLIVFFLCVTEMSDASKEKLDLPLAEQALEDMHEPGRTIININKKGHIFINKQQYSVLSNDPNFPSLVDVLERERRLSWDPVENVPTRAILIRVDEKTKFIEVYKVMLKCMQKQLWKIAFAAKDVALATGG